VSKPLIKKAFTPKNKQRIIPPPKMKQSQINGKLKIKKSASTLVNLEESKIDENEITSSNLFPKVMSESDLFQFKPILSSSLHSKQEFPDDFQSFNVLSTNQLNKQTKSSLSQPLINKLLKRKKIALINHLI